MPTPSISGQAIRSVSRKMNRDAAEQLNDGQRECLRLVLAHHNSKEIARELGVSPHTVDQRLRTAMRILKVQSRFEAARKFAVLDLNGKYQPLIYQISEVETQSRNGNLGSSTGRPPSDENRLMEDVLNGDGRLAATLFDRSEISQRRFPLPHYRGEKNNLGKIARLGWILLIAIGSALSFGGLIAGLEALSRLRG